MRDQDLNRFEQPYPTDPDGAPRSDFPAALGLTLTNLRRLDAAVRGDLDFDAFGIGWWRQQNEPRLQLQQRILVSDCLIAALDGVEHNLEELALHFLELQDAWEQDAEFIKDAFNVALGGPPMKSPPRRRPIDDLIGARINIHMNGVFRAAGSVMDCLASTAIGVTALEENILRADWAALTTRVLRNLQESQDEGRKLQLGYGMRSSGCSHPGRSTGTSGRTTTATCWSIEVSVRAFHGSSVRPISSRPNRLCTRSQFSCCAQTPI